MTQEVDLLSTREQASLILISIFLFWVLSKKDLRANIQRIIWTLLSPVILLPLIVMFAYVSFEVWIGFQLGLWSNQLAKATVIWAVAAGVVLSSKGILEANKDPLFFRKTAAATIAPTVFVTFFMNLASFNLLAEVALQLFLVPVTALSAFAHARTDREYERVKKLCNGILSLVGFSWLAFTVHHVHKTWNQLDTHLLFQKLGLPMWLMIGLLPFIFALSLYAAYERPFRQINSETRMIGVRWRARIAVMLTLHFKARDVAHFQHFWARTLVETNTLGAARAVVRQFEESLRDGERATAEEEYKLHRYAGVDGTDSEGSYPTFLISACDEPSSGLTVVNNQNLSALRPGSKCLPSWVGWNAFLDPLLGRATSIVKVNQPGGLCAQMGHDETDSRKEFPAMPLHLGNDPTRPAPTGGWIAEIGKPDDGLSGWATHGPG